MTLPNGSKKGSLLHSAVDFAASFISFRHPRANDIHHRRDVLRRASEVSKRAADTVEGLSPQWFRDGAKHFASLSAGQINCGPQLVQSSADLLRNSSPGALYR